MSANGPTAQQVSQGTAGTGMNMNNDATTHKQVRKHSSETRQFKMRMSEALYIHVLERAEMLETTLSDYTRDALSFYSYVVDQVSNGGAVAFLDKDGAKRGEFWTPKLTRAKAQGPLPEK